MQDTEWIKDLNSTYGWQLAEQISAAEAESRLAEQIDQMIRENFSGLVQLLYRIDISEARLRLLLQTTIGEDAGRIIARLIIERLMIKIETRRQFRKGSNNSNNNIPEEERW